MPVPFGDDRAHDATRRAQDAFFATLAKEYPEIESGDFDPTDDDRFTAATTDAATAWIKANGADVNPTHDQLAHLAEVANNASIGYYAGDSDTGGACIAIHGRQSDPQDARGRPLPTALDFTITVLYVDGDGVEHEERRIVEPAGSWRALNIR